MYFNSNLENLPGHPLLPKFGEAFGKALRHSFLSTRFFPLICVSNFRAGRSCRTPGTGCPA